MRRQDEQIRSACTSPKRPFFMQDMPVWPVQHQGGERPAGRTGMLYSLLFLLLLLSGTLCGCDSPGQPPVSSSQVPSGQTAQLASEITFYNYEGDMPLEVLEAFTREYGTKVNNQTYTDQDQAMANLRAGKVYDVVVVENRFIPLLIREGLLAELDHASILNLKNISANFRDLVFDPGNRYCIPFNWGTTALVVRSDLVAQPVSRWTDLWDPRYSGRVGLWMSQRRDMLGLALKSLGYSANSENSAELEAALQRLLILKSHCLVLEEFDPDNSSEVMSSGKAVLALGYAKDVVEGRKKNPAITYVLPAEGAMLWGDNFVIPASSPHKHTAEVLINFLLRPDINARISSINCYATANEAALPLIDPVVRNNPVVFPTNEAMQHAEMQLPLSPAGEKLYDEIWQRFSQITPE